MKFLGYFNLLGVLALAVLCVVQWEAQPKAQSRATAPWT